MNFKGIELCCPRCHGDLEQIGGPYEGELHCLGCNQRYPIILGIPDLRVFPDPYIDFEADRAKGRRIAERFAGLDFGGLIDYYYSITSVVPPKHAQQYKRGLMSATARSEATLAAWERLAVGSVHSGTGSLLEIGCGTAPLLVAGADRYQKLVGVDIAFRWLVVGKKRLQEAGLDIPLICACAEALPFPPAATFDRVVAESTLEHLQDQSKALQECYRVMNSEGSLFIATPNRYSLGPDPHAGIWAGGYLPDNWLAAYVRRQGGIPPKRHLLSARQLSTLIRQAGFGQPQIKLPDVSAGQRSHFGYGMKLLIDVYQLAKQFPVSKQILHFIGPLLLAVSQKPPVSVAHQLFAQTSNTALPRVG